MEQIILVVHLLIALAIIGLIMMQRGKGADIGASFGAGASQTLFGSVGSANILTRSTGWLVAAFFATSFGLAMMADSKTAGQEDLGFDLPVEAMDVAPQVEEAPAGDVPTSEIPEVSMESLGEAQETDVPVVDGTDAEVVDSADELPEGQ